jgi:hypothetical protein
MRAQWLAAAVVTTALCAGCGAGDANPHPRPQVLADAGNVIYSYCVARVRHPSAGSSRSVLTAVRQLGREFRDSDSSPFPAIDRGQVRYVLFVAQAQLKGCDPALAGRAVRALRPYGVRRVDISLPSSTPSVP